MRIARRFSLDSTSKQFASLCKFDAVSGSGRSHECCVSYTIAFHVAVCDETQRLARRNTKMKPGPAVLRNNS